MWFIAENTLFDNYMNELNILNKPTSFLVQFI